jgi:7-cyano-7-deazaguanine synthase in queuosine biosynthesis
MPDRRTTVLSMSGGLDSAAAWWTLGRPDWFFVTGGNPHVAKREVEAVERLSVLCPEFRACGRVVDFSFQPFRSPTTWFFPREHFLAALAVGLGYTEILFGYHSWDTVRRVDTDDVHRPITEFLTNYADTPDLVARTPTAKWSRPELIAAALAAGCPSEFLLATWSCQRDGAMHCGTCQNCVERFLALDAVGIAHKFETDPLRNGSDVLVRAHNRGISDLIRCYKKARGIPADEPVYI